ncbi:PEP-CTERM sorting domain-containing protein [Paucibacter sp. Y2R2-4]|uniref:PEP-CTERM sorting domain-containing protein n=1 Tax=Paucibacter sp. Y2R2-4 TaxID=2893553 RepID=UPI0021E50FB4|nr:PEP-CTERM sorting domain-containing protein [Paucibacter sp. Y2R2-4]MCV2350679.1 PEP-CTERM sorting domain-containing protein [Paucibacter sp. Y2R2-4]
MKHVSTKSAAGRHLKRGLGLCLAWAAVSVSAAEPISILFVGNSYTFARVDPVMSYNAANVHDLTAAFNAVNPSGTNSYPIGTAPSVGGSFEQHPWGGVPGVFKKMTDQAGLNYDVSLSARNAASLRGQFLNTANSDWKLRENVASKTWGKVVLQEQSDAALPPGMGKNANLATFNAYADQFERFIHQGAAQSYTEAQLFGSLSNCTATGLSTGSCNTVRNIAANPNASSSTQVYLEQTWARPDMVEAHKITTPDKTTSDGRPIVDTSSAGGDAKLYYQDLAGMTSDLHKSFYDKASSNTGFAGVVPVGDAFQRAVDLGLAKGSDFYNAAGTFEESGNLLDLWWLDRTHASKYGSYLSALTLFGSITGLDPQSLGAKEQAAFDLGISEAQAWTLQQVAAAQLGFAVAVPEPGTWALMAAGLGLLAWRGRQRMAG